MKRQTCLFILIILFGSCRKETVSQYVTGGDGYIIEIRSMSNFDCSIPEIAFISGVNEVKQLLNSSVNIYVATGLPKVYYPAGTQLTVKIKKPEAADAIICTAIGPSYRQVVITEVK